MPNKENIKSESNQIEQVKVIYKGDVTWVGNIGVDEFILVQGQEYELPLTDFVQSLIGQKLLIKSSK